MTSSASSFSLHARHLRLIARLWSIGMLFVWGAFFVEHLGWFRDLQQLPPPVMVLQACHLLLLVGLVIGWRWELAGGIVTLASAVIFFGWTAGPNAPGFLLLTAVPATSWILLGVRQRPVA